MMGTKGLRVVLFTSRNKDNKDRLKGFKERTKTFVSDAQLESLIESFREFSRRGLPGEFCRFYISINTRDPQKIKRSLMHYLIDNDEVNISKIETKLSSIAQRSENAAERKWLFDYDGEDADLSDFLSELSTYAGDGVGVEVEDTPNGYAVIVSRGFDTRELLERWGDVVELKRDALLCIDWMTNPE